MSKALLFPLFPTLLLAAQWCPAYGQSAETAASLWLHSWVPETGGVASSAGPLEKSLAQVAELARRGDFTNAFRQLDGISSSEPAAGYLIRIFRRELLFRSELDLGGPTDQLGDGGLIFIRNGQQANQLTQEAVRLASVAGTPHPQQLDAAINLATFYDTCAIQMVTNLRNDQLNGETKELKTLAAAPQTAGQSMGELEINCGLMSLGLHDSQTADSVSLQLLRLLAEAHFEAGRWNFAGAKEKLLQGLAVARIKRDSSVAGFWLLALGDLEIAPYGSPLTLGFDSSTDAGVRANLTAGVYSKAMSRPAADAIARAEDYYQQSNSPEAELAIRKAYIAWLRKGQDAAPEFGVAAVAAGAKYPALQALALGSQGLLLANEQYYDSGLSITKKSGFSGLALGLVDMADSVASRLMISDPARALAVLNFAALACGAQGFPASAARLDYTLGVDDNALGRQDFAIDAWERAANDLAKRLTDNEQTMASQHLSSPLLQGVLLSQRHNLMGDLVQLAGALNQKFYTEGQEEWRVKRDRYEVQAQELLDGRDDFLQQSWADYLRGRDAATALARTVAITKSGDCDAVRHAYETAKKAAASGRITLALATPAVACDPALRDGAVSDFLAFDPVGELQAAIETGTRQPSFAVARQVQAALGDLGTYDDGLVTLGAGSALLDQTSRLETLVRSNPSLIGRIDPYVELYRAIAFSLEGRNAESRDLLLKVQGGAFGITADPNFKRRVDAALIESYVGLDDPVKSLLALESMESDLKDLQMLSIGLSPQDPDSARLTMLLRQRGVSEVSLSEQQEIRTLEGRFRPDKSSHLARVPNIGEIADHIPEGVVVLAYYAGRSGMLIWRLERGKPPVLRHSKVKLWVINQTIADFSEKLLDRMDGWQPVATDLYRALVEPVGLLDPGVTLAIFGMSSVPFDLLGPVGGRTLILDHPIVYLNELESADDATFHITEGTTSLVIGSMGATLSGVDAEVADVARMLHTRPLPAAKATLSAVLAALPSARFVHVASHGVIDPVNPYRSYLALEDGNLEAWELFRSARQADLVVFSACDTLRPIARTLGEDQTTIGGLTALGGTARVLSSFWAADDSDARQLMTLFYERLETKPALALQKAKVALGEVYRSSNFVLTVQNPSAIILGSKP